MNPERALIADRALAQHCAELLRPAPASDELLARLEEQGAVFAAALAKALAPHLGGELPVVEPGPVSKTSFADLVDMAPLLAANSLLAVGKAQSPVLVVIDGGAVLRLVDRAFGGKGAVPSPLPQAFSLSAELMAGRLEACCVAALAEAWGLSWPGAIASIGQNTELSALAPFADQTRLAEQRFTIRETGGTQWALTLVLPIDDLAGLIGEAARVAPIQAGSRVAANPADEPYGGLPFTLEAVLVDMAMPVSILSALAPGQVLPVTVARIVPLRVGGRTIAHGTIGTLDEHVAVQVNHAF